MSQELQRERSNSRRAKELGLQVMGSKSHASRMWTAGRMEGPAFLLVASPIIFPLLEGEGLRFPAGLEWFGYSVLIGIGILILYWRRNPRAKAVDADLHTHRPWIDQVEMTDGVLYQGMCDCDWRGRLEKKERPARGASSRGSASLARLDGTVRRW
jgi:hypothetical protein